LNENLLRGFGEGSLHVGPINRHDLVMLSFLHFSKKAK